MPESSGASSQGAKTVEYTVRRDQVHTFVAAKMGKAGNPPAVHPDDPTLHAVEVSVVPDFPVRYQTYDSGGEPHVVLSETFTVTVTYAGPGWVTQEPGEAE